MSEESDGIFTPYDKNEFSSFCMEKYIQLQNNNIILRKQLDIAVEGINKLQTIMRENSIFVCGVFTIVMDTLAEIEKVGMNE